ncbi:MAG: ribosome maturation factor RimP [Clostridia bacterium]|nr:ribosome maturation factor RimP [Clostridia bacterium]
MAKAELTTVVTPKCQRLADQMNFELVDVCLEKEGAGSYLRVYIDKPEGISLDDCENYHRALQPLVENFDYDFLEVSSPGVDRPLKKDRDFERAQGSEVEVKLFKPMEGKKLWTGILVGLDGSDIVIEVNGAEMRIPRKAAALVKPTVDMEGVEEVDFSDVEVTE